MVKAIFNVLFSVIKSIVHTILLPIDFMVVTLVPDFSEFLADFNHTLDYHLSPVMGWFGTILPPSFKTLLIAYLYFLITYYTTVYTIHFILKIFHIIKAIKFW